MKLPNAVRVVWWLILSSMVTYFLYRRYPFLVAGQSAPVDIFVFLVWVALLLAPIFQEVKFFGVSLKQEIREAKNELKEHLIDLKADIRNSVDVRSNVNVYPYPPPDAALPHIEQHVRAVLERELQNRPVPAPAIEPVAEVPDDATYLFSVRFAIERELRRIWQLRFPPPPTGRPVPLFQIIRDLVETELMSSDLSRAIRDVLAICSPGIHAENMSPAKVDFVRGVAPDLIATVKALQ